MAKLSFVRCPPQVGRRVYLLPALCGGRGEAATVASWQSAAELRARFPRVRRAASAAMAV